MRTQEQGKGCRGYRNLILEADRSRAKAAQGINRKAKWSKKNSGTAQEDVGWVFYKDAALKLVND